MYISEQPECSLLAEALQQRQRVGGPGRVVHQGNVYNTNKDVNNNNNNA